MLRLMMVCLVLIVGPLTAGEAEELKPKFGDIGGVFYTEVSENREACQQAIRNKIALCEQNSSFVSNTLDRKYPGCLPIFREQGRVCMDHFRSEAFKCQGSGSVRIEDFTGFACTVTATVIEEGDETEGTPALAPADRLMQARTRIKCPQRPRYPSCQSRAAGDRRRGLGDGEGRRVAAHRGPGRQHGLRSRIAALSPTAGVPSIKAVRKHRGNRQSRSTDRSLRESVRSS